MNISKGWLNTLRTHQHLWNDILVELEGEDHIRVEDALLTTCSLESCLLCLLYLVCLLMCHGTWVKDLWIRIQIIGQLFSLSNRINITLSDLKVDSS